MSKLLLIAGIAVLAAVAYVLIRAALLPHDFRVARSRRISAPREKVFPLINDLHGFNQWNPFAKMDPSTRTTYRGPSSGRGAAFDWEGTGRAGKGSMEILNSESPANVRMKLDIVKPMEGHNTVIFTLQSAGDGTDVSWTMTGPYPYLNRIFGTIFNMDKIIGGTFDQGLADLKGLVEK
jgi:uncharacterized protein YndB with AHSA1/START domain